MAKDIQKLIDVDPALADEDAVKEAIKSTKRASAYSDCGSTVWDSTDATKVGDFTETAYTDGKDKYKTDTGLVEDKTGQYYVNMLWKKTTKVAFAKAG